MPRIVRRNLVRDQRGRTYAGNTQRLVDDGRGNLHVTNQQTTYRCPGCRRPVTDLNDLKGVCDCCRVRGKCTHCESRCAACGRLQCWACRRSFAGPPPANVCQICLVRLTRRQQYLDRIAAHERLIAHRAAALNMQLRARQAAEQMRLRRAQLNLMASRAQIQHGLASMRDRLRYRIAMWRLMNGGPRRLR